uniref:EF-hand domain-containing protein n=1 Tax=Caenorhabditis tropicalis TaxID=1561998 RepID=A0A1I7UFY4_9PELO
MKSEMAAAGVSAAGVATISSFMESHKPQRGGNRDAGKAEFDAMLGTLTESDRSAFQKMMQNKHQKRGRGGEQK